MHCLDHGMKPPTDEQLSPGSPQRASAKMSQSGRPAYSNRRGWPLGRQANSYLVVRQESPNPLPTFRAKWKLPISLTRRAMDARCLNKQGPADIQRIERSEVHLKTVRHLHKQNWEILDSGNCHYCARKRAARRCSVRGHSHCIQNFSDATLEVTYSRGLVIDNLPRLVTTRLRHLFSIRAVRPLVMKFVLCHAALP